MIYLVGQIILCLLFTALIGMTMGWLLRGLGTRRQTETVEARWRARVSQLQQQHQTARPADSVATGPLPASPAIEAEIAALKRQIQQRDKALNALRTAQTVSGRASARPATDASQDKDTAQINAQLQGHLAEQKATANQLESQCNRLLNEKEMLIERLRDRETEIGRMGQERQHAINTIAKLQKELRAQRVGDRGEAAPTKTDAVVTKSAVPEPSREAASPSSGQLPAAAQRQGLLIPPDEQSQESPGYNPDWLLSAPRGQKDNLQAIFGIGPKLELQLNNLGIFHFDQIAQFSNDDILWVARHLKSFPGRIVRDRWISQAESLSSRQTS